MTGDMTRLLRLMVSRRRRRKADGAVVESRQYTVTIPSAIVDAFGWNGETVLEVTIEGRGILRIRESRHEESRKKEAIQE